MIKIIEQNLQTTAIHSEKVDSTLTVTVAPRHGVYDGMPLNRSYQLKVLASSIPKKVKVNGVEQDFVYQSDEFALLIDIAQTDCNTKKVVSVEYSATDVSLDGLCGAAKRVAAAMENMKYRNSYIVFHPDFCKLGSIKESIRYNTSKINDLVSEFWENYNKLPLLLKEVQKLKEDDAKWFLHQIKFEQQ